MNQSKSLYPDIDIYIRDLTLDKITPIDSDSMSPYVIASFDIECDSSHGDFPQATKDFKKLSIDIYDTLLNLYDKSAGFGYFDNSVPKAYGQCWI